MELIKKLGTKFIGGIWRRFGLFLCPYCLQEVERRIYDGKKCKSCGCVQYELSSKSLKGHIVTEEIREKISKNNKGKSRGKGKIVSKETRKKLKQYKGELSANWQGGISFEIYPSEFNKELKKFIYERDNHSCQCSNCNEIHNRLHIHHIDYNKKNNMPENLITLGVSCHSKTNFNRDYWVLYYQNIMMGKLMECFL